MPPELADTLPEEHGDFQDHLNAVVQASKLPAQRRSTNIKPRVDALTSICYESGVLPPDLEEIVRLVTKPTFLDQASLAALIRNLYPVTAVEDDVVVMVIGALGLGKRKPSLTIQASLLRWLIMVYPVLGNQSVLSRAYSVLFNLLDTAAIRAPLCHLLALATRRRHVRPHRIQSLLELSHQTGNDPALTGVLRVYKDYYPEIIVGDATRGRSSPFNHPDVQWRTHLEEIQRNYAHRTVHDTDGPVASFRVARRGFGRARSQRSMFIPEVHTSHATEFSVTLEEVEDAAGFVSKLESIELPNQLIAILGDPLLQKLLLLKPHAEAHRRASNWLTSCAQEMIAGDNGFDPGEILLVLRMYASNLKNLPPVFLAFIAEYLQSWNGKDNRAVLFDVLAFVPLLDYTELSECIFQPLENMALDGSTESQLDMLNLYTNLLRNWALSLCSVASAADPSKKALPNQPTATIGSVAGVANALCLTLVQTATIDNTRVYSSVLDFYDQMSHMAADARLRPLVRIVTPPPALVYILLFSGSPTPISRLCGVLTRYKEGFQGAMAEESTSRDYSVTYVNEFNGYLMDVCNCLWRSRAFNPRDPNAHGCLVSRPVVDALAAYVDTLNPGGSGVGGSSNGLAALFSLSRSPALAAMADESLRDREEREDREGEYVVETRHAGPASRASLKTLADRGGLQMTWDEYRLGVLRHLEAKGMGGVRELMNNTMTTLTRKQQQP